MATVYLGRLAERDPLYGYLKYEIYPRLCGASPGGFRVFRLDGSNAVYRYEDRDGNRQVVGKFFLSGRQPDAAAAGRRLEREYHHLELLRSYGFTGFPHRIARPLGRHHAMNRLLVTEYCGGETLDAVLRRAIAAGDDAALFSRLTALAWFLAELHNRTAWDAPVRFDETIAYAELLIGQLAAGGLLDGGGAGAFRAWCRSWRERPEMWSDRQVLVHGDATPANFRFGSGMEVAAFDLERVRRADRVFDTGRLAGELAHYFLMLTGDRERAEPFIGHFLWEYACHFPDREAAFRATTRRVPFYLGITLLRIARNQYLAWSYRQQLIREAGQCLRRWHG